MQSRLRISNRIDSRGLAIATRVPITPEEANRTQESILQRDLRNLREQAEARKNPVPAHLTPDRKVSQQERRWKKLEDKMMTANQVAALLQIHPVTIKRYAQEQKILAYMIGHEWRFFKTDILKFLDSRANKMRIVKSGATNIGDSL